MNPLLIGFATAFGLIAAIGSQNAFVLRQGIRNEHVLPVVILCAASDLVLITAGIAGVGVLVTAHPQLTNLARYGGRCSWWATACSPPAGRSGRRP